MQIFRQVKVKKLYFSRGGTEGKREREGTRGEQRGIFYSPSLADAKEKMPNGRVRGERIAM